MSPRTCFDNPLTTCSEQKRPLGPSCHAPQPKWSRKPLPGQVHVHLLRLWVHPCRPWHLETLPEALLLHPLLCKGCAVHRAALQAACCPASCGWTLWEMGTLVQILPPPCVTGHFARGKMHLFCHGKVQLALQQGHREEKEHGVKAGRRELSHPLHMVGAHLSGGFCDLARAPSLAGMILLPPCQCWLS